MREQIVQDYNAGMPLRQIAEKYYVSHCYVYYYLKGNRRGKVPKGYHKNLIADYISGMKVKDIASKYQVTKQTIINIIRGNNVPMRKGRPRKGKENE